MAGRDDPGARNAVLILLVMGAAFLGYGAWVGLTKLHLLGLELTLNDQANYVSAARHFAAERTVSTDIIYPSTLLQEYSRNYLYMPGHAMLLGLAFGLFGESALVALLPSLFGYGICLLATYACGRKLFGHSAGLNAAAAFAIFPPFTVYAYTAMAELTLLAAGMLALAVFLYLPRSLRPWVAPGLLLVPFLFRETGSLWIIPMVILTLADPKEEPRVRVRSALLMLLASVLLLGLVYRLDWIANRPSLWLQNLFAATSGEKYADAYSVSDLAPTLVDYSSAIAHRAGANLASLGTAMTRPSFEAMGLHLVLWGSLGGAVWAWRDRRFRPLVCAWAVTTCSMALLVTALYQWDTLIGLRQMLMPMMLGAMVWGAAASRSNSPSRYRVTFPVLAAGVSLVVLWKGASEVAAFDTEQARTTELLAELPDPDHGTIVMNWQLGLVYVYENPSRKWAFIPANASTMQLLDEEHDVRVALLAPTQAAALGRDALTRAGLRQVDRIGRYLVFEQSKQR